MRRLLGVERLELEPARADVHRDGALRAMGLRLDDEVHQAAQERFAGARRGGLNSGVGGECAGKRGGEGLRGHGINSLRCDPRCWAPGRLPVWLPSVLAFVVLKVVRFASCE